MSGFRPLNDTFAGHEDYTQNYYMGVVASNNDPLGIGRIQVSVPNLYDPSQGEIPWVGPSKDSPFGYGTSAKGPYGVYGSPQVGSKVMIELQNGDEHKPLYNTLPTVPDANPAFANPATWGFQDPTGNRLLVDMQANTWTWTHVSGDSIAYDGSGNVVEVVKGSETHTITGNLVFNVTGNVSISCQDFNLDAKGTASYTATAHQFTGPVTTSSTISAAGDITDNTGSGNAETMATMRSLYNTHRHHYTADGSDQITDVPFPLT